jgi:hypothetical protein
VADRRSILRSPAAVTAGRGPPVACVEALPAVRCVGAGLHLMLENSRMKVIIRGFGEGYYLMGTKAGGIVDAAATGGEDLIKEILPMFNLNGGGFDEFVITEAGDDGPAEVVVRGPVEAVPFVQAAIATEATAAIVEQHYQLEPDSDALLIRTYLFPIDGADGAVEVGEAFFLGGRVRPRPAPVSSTWRQRADLAQRDTTSYGFTYAGDGAAVGRRRQRPDRRGPTHAGDARTRSIAGYRRRQFGGLGGRPRVRARTGDRQSPRWSTGRRAPRCRSRWWPATPTATRSSRAGAAAYS